MTKLEIIQAILGSETEKPTPKTQAKSFLEVGKVYAIRTVTMIYTGRLMDISETEMLLEDAAWIPETERWAQFVDDGSHKEAEPYKRPVVLSRGAILDVTEIPSTIRKQK